MPKFARLFIAVIAVLLCGHLYAFSQKNSSDRVIFIDSGGHVPFHINSMNKYKSGQTLNTWTSFTIVIDESVDGDPWVFEVSASGPNLLGDFLGNNLDLHYIAIMAEPLNTAAQSLTFTPVDHLDDTPQRLVEGNTEGTFSISISYSIGAEETNNLMGEMPDYYFVELYFDVRASAK